MKIHIFPLVVIMAAAPVVLPAQTGTASLPPPGIPLRPVVSSEAAQPPPPTYELAVKWNEHITDVLTVPLKNESDQTLHVLGIQATGGLFVVDFPSAVSPKKESLISIIQQAPENTDGNLDIIRVLTDQGIKELHVQIVREEVAHFAAREVRWTVGEQPAVKTVALTVAAGTVVPKRVRATGGNSAVLEKSSDTDWQVKITPASTARSGQFAVFVDFDQALPGKAAVILGVIQPRE